LIETLKQTNKNSFERRYEKRRDDIVESVANEEKMLKNNLLREGVLLHQT
jgi:hypothetical protein